MRKKVAFHTLGCKLNFSETSYMRREFEKYNMQAAGRGEDADLVFINTCTVTQSADAKSRKAIRQAVKEYPNAFVVVTGCLAQTGADELSGIEGVDMVLGMEDKFNFAEYFSKFEKKATAEIHSCEIDAVTNFDSAWSGDGRTRSFLKVQDGCNYVCTYCIIPKARGKSRNKSISELLKDAETIAASGKKEIILTGVNIGDFGKSTGESFFDLLKSFDKQAAVPRMRISSVEPNLLRPEIIDLVKDSEILLPHFHIPLQSGSADVLKQMRRAYTPKLFASRIEYIKKRIPSAFLGIDVIVGFPTETDAHFEETYQLLSELEPAFLHVFSYSDRSGTPASESKRKVPSKTIKERSRRLHELSEILHRRFYERHLGETRPVLFEEAVQKGKIFGFTDNYIRVEMPYNKKFVNNIYSVTLGEINAKGKLTGQFVEKN